MARAIDDYLKIKDKKYVIINGAQRESVSIHSPTFGRDHATTYSHPYRQGELGLMHPKVLKFYSNLEKNLKKVGESWIQVTRGSDGNLPLPYSKLAEGDIPIVLYGDSRKYWQPSMNEDYFIIMLRKGEFVLLPKSDLKGVLKEFDEHSTKGLDEQVEEQWRHFEAFDTLKGDRIYETQIEQTENNAEAMADIHNQIAAHYPPRRPFTKGNFIMDF